MTDMVSDTINSVSKFVKKMLLFTTEYMGKDMLQRITKQLSQDHDLLVNLLLKTCCQI